MNEVRLIGVAVITCKAGLGIDKDNITADQAALEPAMATTITVPKRGTVELTTDVLNTAAVWAPSWICNYTGHASTRLVQPVAQQSAHRRQRCL